MLATALSAALVGLDAHPVRVEVEASRGVPHFELVGLAEAAVRESRVRVKAALSQVGVHLSEYCVVVNLGPADLRKSGSGIDVAIAAATLAALGRVPMAALAGVLFIGELSLTGAVQPVRGVLPALLAARRRGVTRAVVPEGNGGEAALVAGVEVMTVGSMAALLEGLAGVACLSRAVASTRARGQVEVEDLADVRGQQGARRALEVAAAGGHNLLLLCAGTHRLADFGPHALRRRVQGETWPRSAFPGSASEATAVEPAGRVVRRPVHAALVLVP